MKKNSSYVKCSRCELNYISKDETLCDVCKAELKLIQNTSLLPEEDDEILCPICKQNYISIDEEMCLKCSERLSERDANLIHSTEEWDYVDEEKSVEDDVDIVSFSELEEEEKDTMFEEEELSEEDMDSIGDEDTFNDEDTFDEDDDFDNDDDFYEDDEDEYDEEDEDDEDDDF